MRNYALRMHYSSVTLTLSLRLHGREGRRRRKGLPSSHTALGLPDSLGRHCNTRIES